MKDEDALEIIEPRSGREVAPEASDPKAYAIASALGRLDIEVLRQRAWAAVARPEYIELQPPAGWEHPVTGRRQLAPDPLLVELGRYLRRARRLVGLSQQRLADRADVSQSMVSRAERALAPSMGVENLTRLGRVLGRAFPLGICPHEHECAWQPARERPRPTGPVERLLEIYLSARADER